MKINTKIRYGLRMLVLLAESGKITNTAELGKKMMVSPKYLRKLSGPMEKYSLIKSIQGIYGGYLLNKKPEEITIAMVFDAFNENIKISDCISKQKCPLSIECHTRPLWEHLDHLIQKEFYKITLNNIMENNFNLN